MSLHGRAKGRFDGFDDANGALLKSSGLGSQIHVTWKAHENSNRHTISGFAYAIVHPGDSGENTDRLVIDTALSRDNRTGRPLWRSNVLSSYRFHAIYRAVTTRIKAAGAAARTHSPPRGKPVVRARQITMARQWPAIEQFRSPAPRFTPTARTFRAVGRHGCPTGAAATSYSRKMGMETLQPAHPIQLRSARAHVLNHISGSALPGFRSVPAPAASRVFGRGAPAQAAQPRRSIQSAGRRSAGPGARWSAGWLVGAASAGPVSYSSEVS